MISREWNQVFVSYAHADAKWLNLLLGTLTPLLRDRVLRVWSDRDLTPGSLFQQEIRQAMERSSVAVLLVSTEFLKSDFIHDRELRYLFKAAKDGEMVVFWVAVSASLYKTTPLVHIQCLNDPARPLEGMTRAKQRHTLVVIAEKVAAAAAPGTRSDRDKSGRRTQHRPVRPIKAQNRRVAVLRFTEDGTAPHRFGYGIAHALGRKLSRMAGLHVLGRASAFETPTAPSDGLAKARELGADLAVSGNVRTSGDNLSTVVQLIDVIQETVVWSQSYETRIGDDIEPIQQLEQSIAESIAKALNVNVHVAQKPRPLPYLNTMLTYSEYLQGRVCFNQRTPAGIKNAISLLTNVLSHEPRHVPALCVLAECYLSLAFYGTVHPLAIVTKARQAIIRAIQLDPSFAEALCTLGTIEAIHDWYWPRAEHAFRAGLNADPEYGFGHWRFALDVLSPTSRHEEAFAEAERGLSLDPISPMANAAIAMVSYFGSRPERALQFSDRALQLEPHFYLAQVTKGFALECIGRMQEACETLQRADETSHSPMTSAALGYMYARSGRRREAKKIRSALASIRGAFISNFWLALIDAGLEDESSALDNLDAALVEPCGWLSFFNVWPVFETLRQHKRAKELIQRINLTCK